MLEFHIVALSNIKLWTYPKNVSRDEYTQLDRNTFGRCDRSKFTPLN
jgi:hypothetical protein